MDDSTIVKCEECGNVAPISTRDSHDLKRASIAIPFGWRVWLEQRGELKYLCPNHNANVYFKRYSSLFAVEG